MMIEQVIVFLVGLSLGSFANVLISRWESPKEILQGYSLCPYCRHRLAWYDLIPIFSFLFLRGRCRYCNRPISWQYPAVELATALVALGLYFSTGLSVAFIFYLLMLPFLAALFAVDLKTMLLPDTYLAPAAVLGALGHLAESGVSLNTFISILLGILAGAGFLGLLFILGKGAWMGFGDVKFGVVLGAFLGWPLAVSALFIAFMAGSLASGILVGLGLRGLRSKIPFGPFLVLGTVSAAVWGESIVSAYARLITW